MFKHVKRFCLLGLAGLLFNIAAPVQAALVSYHFSGMIESGLLLGETYSGQVSFDVSGLTNTGAESVGLTSLTLNFLSTVYSLSDGVPLTTADFLDGNFLGVDYVVIADTDLMFRFISALGTGLPDDQPYFAYDTVSGDSGTGSLVYLAYVDEPLGLVLFSIGLAGLTLFRNRPKPKG